MSGDVEELIPLLAELRGLIAEAHGAAKDLRAALKEHRQVAEDAAGQVVARLEDRANAAVHELERHMQREMNRSAADLNQAVQKAREHIAHCLTPGKISIGPDGIARVEFSGNFGTDPPPPSRNRTRPR